MIVHPEFAINLNRVICECMNMFAFNSVYLLRTFGLHVLCKTGVREREKIRNCVIFISLMIISRSFPV